MKAKLQPADTSAYGNPTAIKPDVAYTTDQGGRVEVYTSAGDNDGGLDWRSVNAFAYLINGVPAGKHLHATVFNSLYDYGRARLVSGKYRLVDSAGKVIPADKTYRPSAAFLKQINQYASAAEAKKFVHVLGAKRSMEAAYKAPSSLARLLKDSGVMKYCKKTSSTGTSTGACLTTSVNEALMHSKYALFEETLDSDGNPWHNVIWVTSANLNGSSGGRKSNTSIAISDPVAYQKLRDGVWDAAYSQKFTAAYNAAMNNGITGTNSDFSFYPSPRKKDFEANSVKAVADLSGKSECKAYLVHSLFNSKRSAILTQLGRLQSAKCDVKILLGENAISDIVDSYFTMSNTARELINRVEFGNVHDKSLTVSWTRAGVNHGFTWGGSANLNGTSLAHDELAFKAEDLTATRAAEQQSERLYQLIRGGKAVVPVSGLKIDPATVAINAGSALTLRPRVTPAGATVKTVTWESSDLNVATVNATTGRITAVAPGTATITATSLSGNKTATAKVTVNLDSPESAQPTASPNIVNNPPTLSMDKYQTKVGGTAADRKTDVVVTWGSGGVDITGTVVLQSYVSGKWKNRTTIAVKNGRGKKSLALGNSRAWRLAARAPANASLGSAAKYSNGYAYTVVKTKANTSKPRVYAPTMAKNGDLIPFLVTWKNPSSRYPTKLRLQYLTKSGWKTKSEVVISGGGTQKFVSAPAGATRKWRVATSTSARPKGSGALVSPAVSIKVVK